MSLNQMSQEIIQNIPEAQKLLAMKAEELAGYVLEHLHSLDPSLRRHESEPNNLANNIKRQYPRQFQERIYKRIFSICDWLKVNGYIAAINSQGFFDFTEEGEATETFVAFMTTRQKDTMRRVPIKENQEAPIQMTGAAQSANELDVFISHSSKDTEIATALIDLLRAALDIAADRIRCTSVHGYKLKGGASTDETLRREVHEATVFIGLITEASLQSAYVLFELGARWGAGRHLLPVLAAGTPSSVLRGPLNGINALRLDEQADVHQMIDDIARELNKQKSSASVYQKYLDALIRSQVRGEAAPAQPARTARSIDDADMEQYRYLCKAMNESGGNTYEVEPGSAEHMWAERMVEKGLLERMVAGQFYSLPRGILGG